MFPIFFHNHGIILYDFGVILKIKFSLSLTVVRVLKLQNVYNPMLSYSRPVVSKAQTGVTMNSS